MKKYFKYYAICWAISLAVFNAIIFVAVSATVGLAALVSSFWVGYAFITIAFIGNLICSFLFFKEENRNKIFLNIPIIHIAYSALVVSLIIGAVAMAVPMIPYWVGVIADILMLAFYAVSIVKASVAADMVSEIDDKVKAKTEFIKMLTADSEHLMNTAKTAELKAEAKIVYEFIRYSDPMSNAALVETETEIEKAFAEFATAINAENTEDATSASTELISLIDLRNKKCKLLK